MSEPFLSEIRIFSFNYAPRGWALCNGQIMSIQQNAALFSLLGTTYGGDGIRTFGLPNLQGSAPMSWGNGSGLSPRVLGEVGGEAAHTLLQAEMPSHTHTVSASSADATLVTATGNVWAKTSYNSYSTTPNNTMSTAAISNVGGQPHDNWPPYLTLNFCIALQGIFPSRN